MIPRSETFRLCVHGQGTPDSFDMFRLPAHASSVFSLRRVACGGCNSGTIGGDPAPHLRGIGLTGDVNSTVPRMRTKLSRAGLSVIRYALPRKITAHLLGSEGRTVCGVRARGLRWKRGGTFDPEHDCKRCAKRVRGGVAAMLSYCPKCALDLNVSVALLPDRRCGNCGLEWK